MKVLIFENEYFLVEGAFEYVNDIYFRKEIEFIVYPNSQSLKNFKEIESFDCVFIDIKLGKNSNLDGFGIIKEIEDRKLNVPNIVIITGNHLVSTLLKSRGIKGNYRILTKPIVFKQLKEIFDKKI